ncbi:tetracycline efflux protein [Escherichia coli]|nr:tetracycline efflux protein [Escherichia coli]
MKPNRPLIVILSTVALDAVGIGLIMPVLPGLLRDLVHSNDVTAHYGILLALYALMQFACAPVLGALSDRFGRRPVLLVSLAGAAVDYAIHGDGAFPLGSLYRADRGRHHRGDWGGSRRLYCRYPLMAMSARGTSAS